MNRWDLLAAYENEEERQSALILIILSLASWGIYLFVIVIALYFFDLKLILVTLVGCVLLTLPLVLIKRRQLQAGSLVFVLTALGTVTFIATVGQGIRDLAVVAYPIVFIFAGLTLNRNFFGLCVGLTLMSICWLVFGEALGWFVTKPFIGNLTNWFYLIGIALLLMVAALAVDLLATNMRKSLEQARQEIAQRKQVEEQLRHQGTHDALTGIYNRAFFEAELARLEHGRQFPVSVVIADVDELKIVNDKLGHAVGDEILRQTANVLCSAFRADDMLARIGGDEFAVLLPATDSTTAEKIVSRIKKQLVKHNNELPDLQIQLSLGTATANKKNLTKAFAIADKRMYAEKAMHKSNISRSSATEDLIE
jgi:diguanylate cyclase (GGDEF)-like protein